MPGKAKPSERSMADPALTGASRAGSGDAWSELASMAAACLLAAGVLLLSFGGVATRFEDLALGGQTTSVYASVDEIPIHCRDLSDAAECIAGFERRGGSRVALWLGNSQVHAVNQYAVGQENAPPILFRRLREAGIDLVTFSQPNANFQEHFLLYSYLKSRLPLAYLILPGVFDDLRETGIRGNLLPALEDPETVALLGNSGAGRRILANHQPATNADMAALEQTAQEHSEAALNAWLERHSTLWALRPQARGRLFGQLYLLRNTLLGITAQSKRKLIEGRYQTNLASAEAMLADAVASGIPSLLYIVPIRHDVDLPYVESEYRRFKADLRSLADRHGAEFADLEELVPASLWGSKDSTNLSDRVEIDFMHFQAPGHVLLATALGDIVQQSLADGRP